MSGHIEVTNLLIVGESTVQFSFRVRGKVTNEDIVCCSYMLKAVSVGRTGVLNDYGSSALYIVLSMQYCD